MLTLRNVVRPTCRCTNGLKRDKFYPPAGLRSGMVVDSVSQLARPIATVTNGVVASTRYYKKKVTSVARRPRARSESACGLTGVSCPDKDQNELSAWRLDDPISSVRIYWTVQRGHLGDNTAGDTQPGCLALRPRMLILDKGCIDAGA